MWPSTCVDARPRRDSPRCAGAQSRRRRGHAAVEFANRDSAELVLRVLLATCDVSARGSSAAMTRPRLLDWPLELLSLLVDYVAVPDPLTVVVDVQPGGEGVAVAIAEAESSASSAELTHGDEAKPDPLEALVGVDSFAASCKSLRAVVEAKDARWWAGVLLPFEIGIPTHLAATIGPSFLRELLMHRHCSEPCNFGALSRC